MDWAELSAKAGLQFLEISKCIKKQGAGPVLVTRRLKFRRQ